MNRCKITNQGTYLKINLISNKFCQSNLVYASLGCAGLIGKINERGSFRVCQLSVKSGAKRQKNSMEMVFLTLNVTYLDIIKPHNVFMLQLL